MASDVLPTIINAVVLLAAPMILLMIHLTSRKRAREIQDVQEMFNTFENALIARMARLEARLDNQATQEVPRA